MGSDLSGLCLSGNLIYMTRTKSAAYYCIAIIRGCPDFVYPYLTLVRVGQKAFRLNVLHFSIRQGFVMAEKPAVAKHPRTSVSVTVKKKICTYKHHHLKAMQEEVRAITLKEDDGLDIRRTTISNIPFESPRSG